MVINMHSRESTNHVALGIVFANDIVGVLYNMIEHSILVQLRSTYSVGCWEDGASST